MDRDSPSYANIDSDISITFGGLNLYYKPRAILNLVKFMGKILKVEKPQKEEFDRHNDLFQTAMNSSFYSCADDEVDEPMLDL